MNNIELINLLTIVLGVMIGILVILCFIFLMLKVKMKKTKNKKEKKNNSNSELKSKSTTTVQNYNKESIFKFMEFDKIDDNMIIQKDGKRYLMVIGCQGVNYDLMSGLEKNSVEQGFIQFLNTLRYPIQIYVQTRTVNLGNSINNYKDRINEISKQYVNKQMEYNRKLRSGKYTSRELDKEKYELTRQRNLYEYGIDIINNTERMSLNRNILSKHYYIIISYYPEEASNSNFDKDEIANLAFSELYTKSQTIINSLAVCGINSKILDSVELAELLYVAYNRDESEKYDLKKALNTGYEDLYSTAPDVLDKRMKELDLKIEEEAIKKANEVIYDVVEESEKEKRVKRKEAELSDLIDQMAMAIIEENKMTIGGDIAEEAVNKIEKESKKKTKEKEGGDKDGKEEKTTRRRKSTRTI